jgi:hypothetical protein
MASGSFCIDRYLSGKELLELNRNYRINKFNNKNLWNTRMIVSAKTILFKKQLNNIPYNVSLLIDQVQEENPH